MEYLKVCSSDFDLCRLGWRSKPNIRDPIDANTSYLLKLGWWFRSHHPVTNKTPEDKSATKLSPNVEQLRYPITPKEIYLPNHNRLQYRQFQDMVDLMRPTEINLHQQSKTLELAYEDGKRHKMSCEYLRVYSPSAEVRGHGPGQEKLQFDKEDVSITAINPMGNYAIQLVFDDGHDSGIYDWNLLYELGENQEEYWADYLRRLEEAGYQRKTSPGQVFHS